MPGWRDIRCIGLLAGPFLRDDGAMKLVSTEDEARKGRERPSATRPDRGVWPNERGGVAGFDRGLGKYV